jgi:hypothetical protein
MRRKLISEERHKRKRHKLIYVGWVVKAESKTTASMAMDKFRNKDLLLSAAKQKIDLRPENGEKAGNCGAAKA